MVQKGSKVCTIHDACKRNRNLCDRKNVENEIIRIKQKPGKTILVFGSPTAVRYLFSLNLIDTFWVIVHPVIFGEGIPFLRDSKKTIKLYLVTSKQLSNGTLCNKYSINK